MTKTLTVLLFGLHICGLAFGPIDTGNDLHRYYQDYRRFQNLVNMAGVAADDSTAYGSVHFIGYVRGVVDSFSPSYFKSPDGVDMGQICDVVGEWLKDNPQKRNGAAKQCILFAVYEAWPTDRNKAGYELLKKHLIEATSLIQEEQASDSTDSENEKRSTE